jgi:hypothetical protein
MKPDIFVVAHHKILSTVRIFQTVKLIRIKISGDGSKVSRISNFVVLSFSLITDDLILSSTDQNVFCIVNCKEDYDHLKLACKPLVSTLGPYQPSSFAVGLDMGVSG